MFHRIREGFLFAFPRDRRKLAYRHGVETFLHSITKSTWGTVAVLLMLDLAGLVDTLKIFTAILNANVLVILAFVGGALLTGVLAGGAAFRKWAANPEPLLEGPKPRGRPPKNRV